jgi:enoyl-CoA hydratase/carnithine racemase
MEYTELLVEKKGNIGTITFNRPDKMNALSTTSFKEFGRSLEDMDSDNNIRVVIITGAGRAFTAGLDLAESKNGPGEEALQVVPQQGGTAWIGHTMRNMKKPVIAALNGITVGGGFSIALACDIRIASEDAKLGGAFLRVGLVPELGSTYNLPRLVGIAKACELIFTAKMIDAKEAKEIGLVNEVVPRDQLQEYTLKMATEITKAAPLALQIAKKALYQGIDTDIDTAVQFEQLGQSTCFKSNDFKEGIQAFLEKRKPEFKGT